MMRPTKVRKMLILSSLVLAMGSAIKLGQGAGSAYALQSTDISHDRNGECENNIAELTKHLQERSLILDEIEARSNERNAALLLGERALEERILELTAAEEKLKSTLSLADGAAEKDIKTLGTIYEAMKSEDAARIFDIMTPEYSAGLLLALQPESSAAILSYMKPEHAYTISTIIAGRNTGAPKE